MKPEAPRIDMPSTANVGEIIMIRTKIRHIMETGWRKTSEGATVERNRLTKFTCSFEGQEVVTADLGSGVSQDPYFTFYAKVTKAGSFSFRWEGDNGQDITETIPVVISEEKV